MKRKLLLAFIISCYSFSVSIAQINKGSVWLGGSLGFYSTKNNNGQFLNKQTNVSVMPSYGKAIKENLILGGLLNVGYSKAENVNGQGEQTLNTYGAGIFIRKYVQLIKGVYLFGNATGAFDIMKSKQKSGQITYGKSDGWDAGISAVPGLSFKLNNKLHLETGLNSFLYIQYGQINGSATQAQPLDTKIETRTISAGASLNNLSDLFIGFRLLLSK